MKIKILIVGDFEFEIYEQAFYNAFNELGFETFYFKTKMRFRNRLKYFFYRIQEKFVFGPYINSLNKSLIKKNENVKPDLMFIYRGRQIYKSTYLKLKSKNPNLVIFSYNNDDAFSKSYPFYYWRHFICSANLFNHIFCYRQKNIYDFKNIGITNTSILMSYYIDKYNFRYNDDFNKRIIDVVFIGHFENDGRDEYLKYLMDENISLKIFGTSWNKSKHYNYFVSKCGPIERVDRVLYNETLNNSKLAIVFLSKRNNDEYTRRCFEIPAAGAVMISERTKTLETMFRENEEILFFDSKLELKNKIKFYLRSNDLLKKISENSSKRLIVDSHEVKHRAIQIINKYKQIKNA